MRSISPPRFSLKAVNLVACFLECDKITTMLEENPETRARVGCCVEIELISRSDELERFKFDLVLDEQADYQAGFLGVSAPLAQAILGEKAGTTVPFFTDELMAVKILSICESGRTPDNETAARRDAAIKDAKDQIEFTNAMLFAASADTKWGEYDADGLDFETWKTRRSKDDEET